MILGTQSLAEHTSASDETSVGDAELSCGVLPTHGNREDLVSEM